MKSADCRRFTSASCLLALQIAFPLTVVAQPNPAHQLSDTVSGMGCVHYSVGGKLPWKRKGGDWLDRQGQLHGDTPYATVRVGKDPLRAGIALDLTELAGQWLAGDRANAGVMLRTLGGNGIVRMPSREADQQQGPVLVLRWKNGREDRLQAVADATLDCSTYKGTGASKWLRVGTELNSVIVFDLPAASAANLRSAELFLQPDKLFGKALTVGVFSAHPPWAESKPMQRGLAAAYLADKGIERAEEVLFAADFESKSALSIWQQLTRSEMDIIDVEEGNGFVPIAGKALKTTLKKGANTALNLRYLFARHHDQEPEELYFRYYLRLGSNWNPDVEGGKLPGLAGTYGQAGWGARPSDGTNGWSTRGAFARSLPAAGENGERLTPIGSYVYQADMKGNYGSYWGWGDGPGGLLQNNRWYAIEQYVKLNTPGLHDGIFRAWIDGRQVMERTGMSFRLTPDLRIESVWMNVYHGGTLSSPRDMSLYIDNVVVARSYIGPMTVK